MELLNLSFNLVNKITEKMFVKTGFVHDSERETHTLKKNIMMLHNFNTLRKREILFKYYISINISQEKA